MTALGNERLFVGDVVEVYNDHPDGRKYMGLCVIWETSDDKYSVSRLVYHDFKDDRSSDSYWLFIKRYSFTEMCDDDVIDEIEYAYLQEADLAYFH